MVFPHFLISSFISKNQTSQDVSVLLPHECRTVDQLCGAVAKGVSPPTYLFFYGHVPKSEHSVDASCLSQWFPAPFEVDGVNYLTAEHYMMAEKARLFGDEETLQKILKVFFLFFKFLIL